MKDRQRNASEIRAYLKENILLHEFSEMAAEDIKRLLDAVVFLRLALIGAPVVADVVSNKAGDAVQRYVERALDETKWLEATDDREPKTEEEINAFLHDHGYDPDEVAARGRATADRAFEKVRQNRPRKLRDWVIGGD